MRARPAWLFDIIVRLEIGAENWHLTAETIILIGKCGVEHLDVSTAIARRPEGPLEFIQIYSHS